MMDHPDPKPKTAIVTGSASGLGQAIAVRLARDGWRIALADVNDQGNQETLAQVKAAGASGRVETLDVSDANAWRDPHRTTPHGLIAARPPGKQCGGNQLR